MEIDLDRRAGLPEETPHFSVEAYGSSASKEAQLLESAYLDFLDVTSVSEFQPPYKIRVLIFADANEYHLKVGKNRRLTTSGVRTIATFEQKMLSPLVVTAASDLLFDTLFDWKTNPSELWVKRGISEQILAQLSGADPDKAREDWRSILKNTGPMPLDTLVKGPGGDDLRPAFRTTTASLVAFLRDWGGRLNFAFFLKGLKDGLSTDDALARAYPGKIRTLSELYGLWLDQDVGALRTPAPIQK